MKRMTKMICLGLIVLNLSACNEIMIMVEEASGIAAKQRRDSMLKNMDAEYTVFSANCNVVIPELADEKLPYCLLYIGNIRKDQYTLYPSGNRFDKPSYAFVSQVKDLHWLHDQPVRLSRAQILTFIDDGTFYHGSGLNLYAYPESAKFNYYISTTRRHL